MVSYLGVTRPFIKGQQCGWLAQNRKARLWKKGFASAGEAAAWLAKGLGVPVASLRRQSKCSGVLRLRPTPLAVSHYHGVVARQRGVNVLYEARLSNVVIRSFSSEAAAAAFVAKRLGVPVKQLKRNKVFTRRLARQLFRAAYSAFKKYIPGDLQHLMKEVNLCSSAWQQVARAG